MDDHRYLEVAFRHTGKLAPESGNLLAELKFWLLLCSNRLNLFLEEDISDAMLFGCGFENLDLKLLIPSVNLLNYLLNLNLHRVLLLLHPWILKFGMNFVVVVETVALHLRHQLHNPNVLICTVILCN
ncbi:hypothetical protein AAHE18_03G019100 [Arachis hypogaea]